jgi:hypothetical protein
LDQHALARYRAKIAAHSPAVSRWLIVEDVVIFDAGQRGFDLSQATESLK